LNGGIVTWPGGVVMFPVTAPLHVTSSKFAAGMPSSAATWCG
jgi:hypothetical protein